MDKDIVIIGGGIIGLSTAYYLNKSGYQVTIVEKNEHNDNCSFGNAGMIVPSHFIPLAAPGMLKQGIRWMFDKKSPFYVRPSFDPKLFTWGMKFIKSANNEHVKRSARPLLDLSLLSRQLYQEFTKEEAFSFGFEDKGILMLYKTGKAEEEENHAAIKAQTLGLDAVALSKNECEALQPELKLDILGGIHYRCDAHLNPNLFIQQLITYLDTKGVKILKNNEVIKIEASQHKITRIITKKQAIPLSKLLIAGGAWSQVIANLAGTKLSLMPGKGYSFMTDEPDHRMSIPALLSEARVSITPMGDKIRYGGTMEIGAVNHTVNMNRLEGIVQSIPKYIHNFNPAVPAKENIWYGFRPCSPDGLPYIGKVKKFDNLFIATGHGMMGLSMGPGTGKVMSELITEQSLSINLNAFDPNR